MPRRAIVLPFTRSARKAGGATAVVAALALALPLGASAAPVPDCGDDGVIVADDAAATWVVTADCTTATAITVPDGVTLAGDVDGVTITAVNTTTNAFGPIIRNGGATMHVRDLEIVAQVTAGSNPNGDRHERLAGILFHDAGGSVSDTKVSNVRRAGQLGNQDGYGVHVISAAATPTPVTLSGLDVTDYQKTGVMVWGDVDVSLTGSTIGSSNIAEFQASNSVTFGLGAGGTIDGNRIAGNVLDATRRGHSDSTPRDDWDEATAILLWQAADVRVIRNVITGPTDVGIGVVAGTTNVEVAYNLLEGASGDAGYETTGLLATATTASIRQFANTARGFDAAIDAPSAENVAPADPLIPAPPTGLTATSAPGTGRLAAGWTAAAAPIPFPVTGYSVRIDGALPVVLDPATTSHTVDGLAPGVHTITVVATYTDTSSAEVTASADVTPATTTSTTTTTTPVGDVPPSPEPPAPGPSDTPAPSAPSPSTATTVVDALDKGSVSPGEQITIRQGGFKPFSQVEVSLHSEPVVLGTLTADAAGFIEGTFTVPSGVTAGVHHVVMAGIDPSGDPVVFAQAIVVDGPGTVADGRARGAGTNGSRAPQSLAFTGSTTGTSVALAIGMLMIGAALALSTRHRPSRGT